MKLHRWLRLITPDKFLKFAKRIVSNSNISEEESRSAISRAYYSLYHETLTKIVNKYSFDLIKNVERDWGRHLKWYEKTQLNSLDPKLLRKCNFHKVLPNTLHDIKENILAMNFKNFRDKRNQADYDLKLNFTHTDADTVVNNIDGLVKQVRTL